MTAIDPAELLRTQLDTRRRTTVVPGQPLPPIAVVSETALSAVLDELEQLRGKRTEPPAIVPTVATINATLENTRVDTLDRVAERVQAFLDARGRPDPVEPSLIIPALAGPDWTHGRWLQLYDDDLRSLLGERKRLIYANNGLRYLAEQAQERAQAAGDSVHAMLSTGRYQGPPISQELADALNGPRTVVVLPEHDVAAAQQPAVVPVDPDETDDDEDAPWSLADLTAHLSRQDPDADGRVVREVTRRMAAQLPDTQCCDPGLMSLDLSYALTALATVALEILDHLSDLEDEEKPEGASALVEHLCTAGNTFAEIHGRF